MLGRLQGYKKRASPRRGAGRYSVTNREPNNEREQRDPAIRRNARSGDFSDPDQGRESDRERHDPGLKRSNRRGKGWLVGVSTAGPLDGQTVNFCSATPQTPWRRRGNFLQAEAI